MRCNHCADTPCVAACPTGAITFNVPASTNAAGAETMAITGIELDMGNATQFGSGFGVTNMSQDGFSAGLLTAIAIEPKTARPHDRLQPAAFTVCDLSS